MKMMLTLMMTLMMMMTMTMMMTPTIEAYVKVREDQICQRAALLEKENSVLRAQVRVRARVRAKVRMRAQVRVLSAKVWLVSSAQVRSGQVRMVS